jgi:plastocyanin
MNRVLRILIPTTALSLALTACGGSGNTINVTMTDFAYLPNSFTVPAAAQITINARNNGATEHEFVIMKKGYTVTPPFGDKDEGNIYWELDQIEAGTTKTATFTAPSEPGTYQVVCGLLAHIEKGMVATLIVK